MPYESAARVLPQSKRSFAGYVVRQGLAIAMEVLFVCACADDPYTIRITDIFCAKQHNFLASAAGRENFKNQLQQARVIVCVCVLHHAMRQLTVVFAQLVGSVQLTNDLDVHVALLHAPSYQKQMVSEQECVCLATYDTLTLCVW